jgi:hypothetical protein
MTILIRYHSLITVDGVAVVPQCLVSQCCPWVGEVRQFLSQWVQGRRHPALGLEKAESYRKITPIAAPLSAKPDQVSYRFVDLWLQ